MQEQATQTPPTDSKPDKKIPLVELFGPTVQGEGAVIGLQTYFLRFGLCDYKCKMCDSMHAVDPHQVKAKAEWLTQESIYARLCAFHKEPSTNWVTFSGGNPCIHDLSDLALWMRAGGFNISVETQGTFCPDWLNLCNSIAVSPKGPGMGEIFEDAKLASFLAHLSSHPGLFLKIVVFDQRDLEFASMLYERYVLSGILRSSQFFLSQGNPFPPGRESNPALNNLPTMLAGQYVQLLEEIMRDKNLCNVKFLPQMHVWLWGNKQGV